MSCEFSPSCRFFAQISSDNRLKIWSTDTGTVLQQYTPPAHLATNLTCLAWGAAPGSSSAGAAGASKKQQKKAKSASEVVAVGFQNGNVIVWDCGRGEVRYQLSSAKGSAAHAGKVVALCFDVSGNVLYSCGEDSNISSWNAQNGTLISTFSSGKSSPPQSLAISPDGSILAAGGAAIKLFDTASNSKIKRLSGHASNVANLVFSADGTFLLSSSADRFINLWKMGGDEKTPVAVFTMESTPRSLHVNPFASQGKFLFEFLGVSQGGVVELFRAKQNILNKKSGSAAPPVTAGTKISIAKGGVEGRDSIQAALFDVHNEVIFARGASLKPVFEKKRYVDEESGEFVTQVSLSAKTGGLLLEGEASAKKKNNVNNAVYLADEEVVAPPPHLMDVSGDSKKKKKNKTAEDAAATEFEKQLEGDEEEESLEKRVQKLNMKGVPPPAADFALRREQGVPKADSVISMLTQAMQNNDAALMESALDVQDRKIIHVTVQRLPPPLIPPLLSSLVDKFRASPGRAPLLLPWIKSLLLSHASFLMSLPDLPLLLSPLFQLSESRLSNFKKLLRLSGRLDLALSQIAVRGGGAAAAAAAAGRGGGGVSMREPKVTYIEEAMTQAEGKKKKKKNAKKVEAMDIDDEEGNDDAADIMLARDSRIRRDDDGEDNMEDEESDEESDAEGWESGDADEDDDEENEEDDE